MVGAAGRAASTNHRQPPLQMLFVVVMYFTNRQSDPWDKALRRFKEDLHKDLEEILINIGKHVNYVWNKSHIKNLLRK